MSDSSAPGAPQLSAMLLCIGLLTGWAGQDSLERYFDARYHLTLADGWQAWLSHDEDADTDDPSAHVGASSASSALDGVPTPPQPMTAPSDLVAASGPPPSLGSKKKNRQVYVVRALPMGMFLPSLQQQKLPTGPQRILFAGDSLMQGVAPLVIRELGKRHPDWESFDLSRQSTGLTVKRYFDWPARIIEEIDAKKLTLVVVFLGPNDPWDIYEPGRHLVFPSPQWAEHYASRVDEVLNHAKARGVRVIWVGLPSMRDGRVRDGAIVQNYVFSERARAHGTDYLATEGLIGPLSLPFKRTLDETPPVLDLRAADGIHFTPAGLRKISTALLAHIAAATPSP
jgi:hypothetical protein